MKGNWSNFNNTLSCKKLTESRHVDPEWNRVYMVTLKLTLCLSRQFEHYDDEQLLTKLSTKCMRDEALYSNLIFI